MVVLKLMPIKTTDLTKTCSIYCIGCLLPIFTMLNKDSISGFAILLKGWPARAIDRLARVKDGKLLNIREFMRR